MEEVNEKTYESYFELIEKLNSAKSKNELVALMKEYASIIPVNSKFDLTHEDLNLFDSIRVGYEVSNNKNIGMNIYSVSNKSSGIELIKLETIMFSKYFDNNIRKYVINITFDNCPSSVHIIEAFNDKEAHEKLSSIMIDYCFGLKESGEIITNVFYMSDYGEIHIEHANSTYRFTVGDITNINVYESLYDNTRTLPNRFKLDSIESVNSFLEFIAKPN